MASRAHHLVFRELSAGAGTAGLSSVSSSVRFPVQFLLRDGRHLLSATVARHALAPDGGGRLMLSRTRRRAHASAHGATGRGPRSPADRAHYTGVTSRAAASGAVAHRYQKSFGAQPHAACVPAAPGCAGNPGNPVLAMARISRRHG